MNESAEVKLHFLDYWRVIKLRMGLILLTFFLVMVTAGVTTYFMPKQYFSKVTMEVKQDNSGPVTPFGSGPRAHLRSRSSWRRNSRSSKRRKSSIRSSIVWT